MNARKRPIPNTAGVTEPDSLGDQLTDLASELEDAIEHGDLGAIVEATARVRQLAEDLDRHDHMSAYCRESSA